MLSLFTFYFAACCANLAFVSSGLSRLRLDVAIALASQCAHLPRRLMLAASVSPGRHSAFGLGHTQAFLGQFYLHMC